MEHVDVILKIIEAEKAAQQVADEAINTKNRLGQNLEREKAGLHEQFMERARRRVEIVREQESRDAEDSIARLDGELTETKAALRVRFDANKEAWAEELFAFVAFGES